MVDKSLNIGFWFPRPDRGARLAEEIRKQGNHVSIYHNLSVPGSQSYVHKTPYHLLRGLTSLLSTEHDVYYTSSSFVPVLQLYLQNLIRGKPYIYTLNAPIWAYYKDKNGVFSGLWSVVIYPLLLKMALSRASSIVANSIFLSDILIAKFPMYKNKIAAIHNGINFDMYHPSQLNISNWEQGRVNLLSVSTINFHIKTNGIILILKSFDILSKKLSDVTLLITVKCSYGNQLNRIQEFIGTLSSSSRIRIDVNRYDVPELLSDSDIFVYATPDNSSDSLPRALLEAQASGIPIITTDTVGCPEAVCDGITGVVVPYDANCLAYAIVNMINNPHDAKIMASYGSKVIRDKFSWKTMSHKYIDIFADAISM